MVCYRVVRSPFSIDAGGICLSRLSLSCRLKVSADGVAPLWTHGGGASTRITGGNAHARAVHRIAPKGAVLLEYLHPACRHLGCESATWRHVDIIEDEARVRRGSSPE